VAATLCEWAEEGLDIILDESSLPVRADVRAACALLGLDPLFVANEGIALLVVPQEATHRALELLRGHTDGVFAAKIGEVLHGNGRLLADTDCGARRQIVLPTGEILPRIC